MILQIVFYMERNCISRGVDALHPYRCGFLGFLRFGFPRFYYVFFINQSTSVLVSEQHQFLSLYVFFAFNDLTFTREREKFASQKKEKKRAQFNCNSYLLMFR